MAHIGYRITTAIFSLIFAALSGFFVWSEYDYRSRGLVDLAQPIELTITHALIFILLVVSASAVLFRGSRVFAWILVGFSVVDLASRLFGARSNTLGVIIAVGIGVSALVVARSGRPPKPVAADPDSSSSTS